MTLDEFGSRICIMGPSNSGKSTLAEAIARARGCEAVHLDQLHHFPHTDWVPRPTDEFTALHDATIMGARRVIEGNYLQLLPQKAGTGDRVHSSRSPHHDSLHRYLRRCWFERDRRGALEGGRDSVKWDMIRHIAVATGTDRSRYRNMIDGISLGTGGGGGVPFRSVPTHEARSRRQRQCTTRSWERKTMHGGPMGGKLALVAFAGSSLAGATVLVAASRGGHDAVSRDPATPIVVVQEGAQPIRPAPAFWTPASTRVSAAAARADVIRPSGVTQAQLNRSIEVLILRHAKADHYDPCQRTI